MIFQTECSDESIKPKLELLSELIEQHQYLEALALCDEIIATDDAIYNVYYDRSRILYRIGHKSEAFQDLEILMKLRPWSPSAHITRAEWNLEIGHDLLAIEDLTFVIDSQDAYFLEAYSSSPTTILEIAKLNLI